MVLVIPTGRIPQDCVELDKDECEFKHQDDEDNFHCADDESDTDQPNAILDRLAIFEKVV